MFNTRLIVAFSCFCLVGCALAGGVIWWNAEPLKFCGMIIGPDQQPVAGAAVTVSGDFRGKLYLNIDGHPVSGFRTFTTDAQGRFCIRGTVNQIQICTIRKGDLGRDLTAQWPGHFAFYARPGRPAHVADPQCPVVFSISRIR